MNLMFSDTEKINLYLLAVYKLMKFWIKQRAIFFFCHDIYLSFFFLNGEDFLADQVEFSWLWSLVCIMVFIDNTSSSKHIKKRVRKKLHSLYFPKEEHIQCFPSKSRRF